MITPIEKDVEEIKDGALRSKIGGQLLRMKSIFKLGMDPLSADRVRIEYQKNEARQNKLPSDTVPAEAGAANSAQVAANSISAPISREYQHGQVVPGYEAAPGFKHETASATKHHEDPEKDPAADSEQGIAPVKVEKAPKAVSAAETARSSKTSKPTVEHDSSKLALKHPQSKTSHKPAAPKRTPEDTTNVEKVEKKNETASRKSELSQPSNARMRGTTRSHNTTEEPRAADKSKSSRLAAEPLRTGNAASTKAAVNKKPVQSSDLRTPAPTGNRVATTESRMAKGNTPTNKVIEKPLPKQEPVSKKPAVKKNEPVGVQAVYTAKPNIKIKTKSLHSTQATTARTSANQRLNSKKEPEPTVESDSDDSEDEILPVRHSKPRTAGMRGVAVPTKKQTAAETEPTDRKNENVATNSLQAIAPWHSVKSCSKPQCEMTNEELRLLVKPWVTVTTQSGYIVQTVTGPWNAILFKTQPVPSDVGDLSKEVTVAKKTTGPRTRKSRTRTAVMLSPRARSILLLILMAPPSPRLLPMIAMSRQLVEVQHLAITLVGLDLRQLISASAAWMTIRPPSSASLERPVPLLGPRYVKTLLDSCAAHTDQLQTRQQAPLASSDDMLVDGTSVSPAAVPPRVYEPGHGRADLAAWSGLMNTDELWALKTKPERSEDMP